MISQHSSISGRCSASKSIAIVTGRAVAVCTVAGIDLAHWLVRGGLALDWPRYSHGDYVAA